MAPHINFWIVARGINIGLHTRMYFSDEAEANAKDPVLRMIEQDAPLLAVRVAPLSPECQQSAKLHADSLAALTRAELKRLMQEKASTDSTKVVLPARRRR